MNITITDSAQEKILAIMAEAEYKKPALRIVFAGIGWGGPRLGLALDELENSSDQIVESDDIKILVDERVSDFLETIPALTVNYIETKYGAGFVFEGLKTCWNIAPVTSS